MGLLRMLWRDVQEADPGETGVAMHPQCSTGGVSLCWKPTQAPGALSCFALGATQRNLYIQTRWQQGCWIAPLRPNTPLAECLSQAARVCFGNRAVARAFLESVHRKPRQWEACSKGIRGDLNLISLRGLISKIISHTEQKELPNDLWVSQLLPVFGEVAENGEDFWCSNPAAEVAGATVTHSWSGGGTDHTPLTGWQSSSLWNHSGLISPAYLETSSVVAPAGRTSVQHDLVLQLLTNTWKRKMGPLPFLCDGTAPEGGFSGKMQV